jgi:hypothetical protein
MILTWRNRLLSELKENNDDWSNIISINIEPRYNASNEVKQMTTDQLLDLEQDFDYGGDDDMNMIVWTDNYIYFSYEYDGLFYLESIPRNPTIEAPKYWRIS